MDPKFPHTNFRRCHGVLAIRIASRITYLYVQVSAEKSNASDKDSFMRIQWTVDCAKRTKN